MPETDHKKTLVVVGAGPGLGLAVARLFGRNGYRAAMVARRRESVDSLVGTLEAEGIEASGYVADVRDAASLERAFDEILARFGRVDALEYSPIAMEFIPPSAVTADIARSAFEFQCAGAVVSVQRVLPGMLEAGDGILLFTTGRSAILPMKLIGSLGLGASALRHYAYSLNEELGKKGVYAGTIAQFNLITPEDAAEMAEIYWDMATKRDRVEEIHDAGPVEGPAREISRLAQQYSPFDMPAAH